MDKKIVGYTEIDGRFDPIYPPDRGTIVTRAFILCKYCRGNVYHCEWIGGNILTHFGVDE
jgi:hypothetical protein